MVGILAFIVVFGVLVTVHELGHLIFAKRAGIYCPEFAIGMGPKIFSYKFNDTLYTIRLLPVGGYVRMSSADMEVNPLKPGMSISIRLNEQNEITHVLLDDKHNFTNVEKVEVIENDFMKEMVLVANRYSDNEVITYHLADTSYYVENSELERIPRRDERFETKSPFAKFMTLFAGPLFNFLLAAVLFIVLAYAIGRPSTEPIVGEVQSESPAEASGLVQNDKIIAINDETVKDWTDMTVLIQKYGEGGEALNLEVERDGNVEQINLEPAVERIEGPDGSVHERLIIGVMPVREKGAFAPILWGLEDTYDNGTKIFKLLVQMIGSIFNGTFSFDMLNGPVGIYKVTETVAAQGLIALTLFTGMLSVNLGIVNLLPIPALDGGRILFALYEMIFRKPVNRKVEINIQIVGVLFVILIMILVTWNDIKTFIIGG